MQYSNLNLSSSFTITALGPYSSFGFKRKDFRLKTTDFGPYSSFGKIIGFRRRINTATKVIMRKHIKIGLMDYSSINKRTVSNLVQKPKSDKLTTMNRIFFTTGVSPSLSRRSSGMIFTRLYSYQRYSPDPSYTSYHWDRLMESITNSYWKLRFPGSIYASTGFQFPYPRATDWPILALAYFRLIDMYASQIESDYIKFTIGYKMNTPSYCDIPLTLGKAIPFYDSKSSILKEKVFEQIENLLRLNAEKYQNSEVTCVFIHFYYIQPDKADKELVFHNISNDLLKHKIFSVFNGEKGNGALPDAQSLLYKRSRTKPFINSRKDPKIKMRRSFIVSDLETVLVNDVHKPYAAGFLVVNPGDDLRNLPTTAIQTFISEDHTPHYPTFLERSDKMLEDFFTNLESCVKLNPTLRTVFLHNLGRFDGLFIMKYFVNRADQYKIKSLMRNHRLYEFKVYKRKGKKNKLLFRFRDSLVLLPGSLDQLGKTLCPELGSKGSIDHESLSESNLKENSQEIIEYLRQDILILGGVMLKAQEIYFLQYTIDIEDVMTAASLSLRIFREKYFDTNRFQIYKPNKNEDTFIRRGYFGGHVDVYKPHGENLYYYDVNSLYPFIMKSYPMPCGKPVWRNNLKDVELESLYGFIEAYVDCPTDIERPFLPYKDKAGTLIFPTGKFIGVFYSEELKFARQIGYDVIPLRGYIYQKQSSPFDSFISSLYSSRLDAKKAGDESMSFIYKLLMNSLYGRFGMNPESIVTDICTGDQYLELLQKGDFASVNKLTDEYYLVNYTSNKSFTTDEEWRAPKNSAVQISAAITACARIHMYPFISRKDCFYTDTDSIVLGNPLPEEYISSVEMGKLKLEHKVKSGIFLAPKTYVLVTEDDKEVMKNKGPAKEFVTYQWFKDVLANQSLSQQIITSSNFLIDWKKLEICRKSRLLKLALPNSTKRERVYNKKNVWIGTKPIEVVDLANEDASTVAKHLTNKMKSQPHP